MLAVSKLHSSANAWCALVCILLLSGASNITYAQTATKITMEKSIKLSIEINAPIEKVWSSWLTPEGTSKFFAPGCLIDPKPLGQYDIYFMPDAPAGQRGAEGNYIMAMQDKRMLSFTWDAPPQFPEIRKHRTLVVLRFNKLSENKTQISLHQTGWGEGKEWDEVYNYFIEAWGSVVLPFLKYSLEVKPVDWSDFPKNLPQGLKPALNLNAGK
ncbi:MAG: SRPBCC domain-containing protein [Flammeovirgaceae bacterium]|nr:SRPBCC domain-containing protein [Flammeovirgaceae bacterium]